MSTPKKPSCPHKKTDYRYHLWVKERKALYARAKRNSFHVDIGKPARRTSGRPRRPPVTIDTSKAGSNLEVLRLCLKELRWREYPLGKRDGGHCDVYWKGAMFSDANGSGVELDGGKINKFPGMVETVRKVNLCRSLDLHRSLFPSEYNFHPMSWFLPQQLPDFCDRVRRMNMKAKSSKDKPVFIVKPDEGSQGGGIYLITDPKEYITEGTRKHVVQEYISDPLLIDKLKFDFRLYVVVTSLDPLEIYISKEGLARFCTKPYEPPTQKNMHESYMHLTNYSLNKNSETYVHTDSEDNGSKQTVTSVFKKLRRMGMNVDKIWDEMKRVVVKTMIALVTELRVEYRAALPPSKPCPSCFQILGFDILLTSGGKPLLLEVNASPSLRIDYEHEVAPGSGIIEHLHSPVDEEIKKPVILETLKLVAPRSKPRSQARAPSPPKQSSSAKGHQQQHSRARLAPSPESESEDTEWETLPVHKDTGVLEQIYPAGLVEEYSWLCVLDRAAEVFLDCLGVRGSLRMGSTGFRTFTRKCKVTGSGSGFTNASLDIMYIDLLRRWEHHNPQRGAGLCYQGFLEAFFHIAEQKYPSETILHSVRIMLDHCESSLNYGPNHKPRFPMIRVSKRDQKLDTLKSVYGGSGRTKLGNSYYLDYQNFPVEKSTKKHTAARLPSQEAKAGRNNGKKVPEKQTEQ